MAELFSMLQMGASSGEGPTAATPAVAAPEPPPAAVDETSPVPPTSATVPTAAATSAPGRVSTARWWRDHVSSPWVWKTADNQAGALPRPVGGEAGGYFVTSETLGGRRAYLKPTKRCPDPAQVRAVREKIVSDLAFDLGIKVPPVVLYKRPNCPGTEEPFVCVSLVLYPMQWPWEQIRNVIMDGKPQDVRDIVLRSLPRAAARGLALDTWVEQLDHGGQDGKRGHPHNIVYGYPWGKPEEGDFVFLDYAWSLGFPLPNYSPDGWAKGGWKRHRVHPPFPAYMLRYIDKAELERSVAEIESYREESIVQLVTRMPTTHLVPEQRDIIIEGLIGRKSLVRVLLSEYFEKGKST